MNTAARPTLSPSPTTDKFPNSRNPISLRLYKALSSSFQDSASREALETLSAFYAPPQDALPVHLNGHAPLKLHGQDAESDEEDDDEVPSLALRPQSATRWHDPQVIGGDITVAENARKNLRRDVEMQLAESSAKFLQAFGQVDQVRTVCYAVDTF